MGLSELTREPTNCLAECLLELLVDVDLSLFSRNSSSLHRKFSYKAAVHGTPQRNDLIHESSTGSLPLELLTPPFQGTPPHQRPRHSV